MNQHEKINYLEFPANNLKLARNFFSQTFGWSFTDYGPEYTAFSAAGIEGGFYHSSLNVSASKGSVLVVLYSNNLQATRDKIEKAGGKITVPVFSFPGGHRFHFTDPNSNEFAVWSDCYKES